MSGVHDGAVKRICVVRQVVIPPVNHNSIHNLQIHVEQWSADHEAARRYLGELQRIIEEFGFKLQTFNADKS